MQLVAILIISAPIQDDVTSNILTPTHSVMDDFDENANEDLQDTVECSPITKASTQPDPETLSIPPIQVVKTRKSWILWFTFVAFWIHMCETFGYKMCMLLVTTFISILYSTLYSRVGHSATYAIWIWAIFFSFCGNLVLLSSKNYGLMITGSATATPIAILTQVLFPIVGFLGRFTIFYFFSVAAAILTPNIPGQKMLKSKPSFTCNVPILSNCHMRGLQPSPLDTRAALQSMMAPVLVAVVEVDPLVQAVPQLLLHVFRKANKMV